MVDNVDGTFRALRAGKAHLVGLGLFCKAPFLLSGADSPTAIGQMPPSFLSTGKEWGRFWWSVAPCKGARDSSQLFQNYWFVGLGVRVVKMLGAERRAACGGIFRETAKGNVYVTGAYQRGNWSCSK